MHIPNIHELNKNLLDFKISQKLGEATFLSLYLFKYNLAESIMNAKYSMHYPLVKKPILCNRKNLKFKLKPRKTYLEIGKYLQHNKNFSTNHNNWFYIFNFNCSRSTDILC